MEKNKKTGVIYDPNMNQHTAKRVAYEKPSRVQTIIEHLQKIGLINHANLEFIQKTIPASKEHALMAHPKRYIDYLERLWPNNCQKDHIYYRRNDQDTYYNKFTSASAYLAAGSTIQAADKVMTNQWTNAFCIIRPPGHHASKTFSGFCFLNNVAICAKYLKNKYNLKRIVILDWDVHQGDGTQKLIEDDQNILFISIHRHDKGQFYPGISGATENAGKLQKGMCINIPWNLSLKKNDETVGDWEYVYLFERMILPLVKDFNPEIILISAGFDSARGDPLGELNLSQDGYAYMTQSLMNLVDNRVIVLLEGGYNLQSLTWSSEAVLRVLLGEQMPLKNCEKPLNYQEIQKNTKPNFLGLETVERCINYLRQFWPKLVKDKVSLEYEDQIKASLISQNDIILQQKYFLHDNCICLPYNESIIQFNQDLNNSKSPLAKQNQLLLPYIPVMIGTKTIDQAIYVCFQNIFYKREEFSIIKIILPLAYEQNVNKKESKLYSRFKRTCWLRFGFYISDFILKSRNHLTEFQWKNHNKIRIKKQEVVQMLKAFFVDKDGKTNKNAILELQQFIENITPIFKFKEQYRVYTKPIIVLLYSRTSSILECKLLNMDKHKNYSEQLELKVKQVQKALENILKLTKDLISEKDQHEEEQKQ